MMVCGNGPEVLEGDGKPPGSDVLPGNAGISGEQVSFSCHRPRVVEPRIMR